MTTYHNYQALNYWLHSSGSMMYYITAQQALANDTKAPPLAIYQTGKDKWVTLDEVINPRVREEVINLHPELAAACGWL